jgi:hypothetical protein
MPHDPHDYLPAGRPVYTCACLLWGDCPGCPDRRHPVCPSCGRPKTVDPLSQLSFQPHSPELHRCEGTA